jgi:hypothetical protein
MISGRGRCSATRALASRKHLYSPKAMKLIIFHLYLLRPTIPTRRKKHIININCSRDRIIREITPSKNIQMILRSLRGIAPGNRNPGSKVCHVLSGNMARSRIAAHINIDRTELRARVRNLNLSAEVVFCAALEVLQGLRDGVAAVVYGCFEVPT